MDKLNAVIVGALGLMAGRRLAALRSGRFPDVEVKTLIDVPQAAEKLKARAAELGVAWATSLDDVLEREDVDVVLVATHTAGHHVVAARALRAGKHVFVEKPTAKDEREADELAQLAYAAGVVLFTGFNRRYLPLARAAALLAEHVVGDVLDVRAEAGHCNFVGQTDARTRTFLSDPGAGPLLDLGVHALDLALLLTGGGFDEATGSASYNAALLCGTSPAIERAEFVRALDGARLSVQSAYVRARRFMGLSVEVNGTLGYLRLDMGADPLRADYHALTCATFACNPFGPSAARALLKERGIRVKSWEEAEGSERGCFFRGVFYDNDEAWTGDLRAFVDTVREGRDERSRAGVEALAMIGAARRSARAGGAAMTCGVADVAVMVG